MRGKSLAVLLGAALLSSGCISQVTLGQMEQSIRPEQVLLRPEIGALVQRGANVGQTMLGALVVILALICWYRAQQGAPFVGLIKEWVLWVGLTIYIIVTVRGGALGPVMWIYEAGRYLGQLFSPGAGYLFANHDIAVGKMAEFVEKVMAGQPPGAQPGPPELLRFVEGYVFALQANQTMIAGILINAVAIHLFKMILQVSYTFLLVFYWTLTPMVAVTLVLPQTRHIFVGWLKSYVSVALWPFFFAIVEQLAIAIPWSTWLGIERISNGPSTLQWFVEGIAWWSQSQISLLVLNLAFLAVYASIPVISNRIVNGATQPFRTGLF